MEIFNTYGLRLKCVKFINYSYLIVEKSSNKACIIDPSWELAKIERAISNLKVNLQFILLTHAHFDHINLAECIARKYDIDVYMSEQEIQATSFKCYKLHALNDGDRIELGKSSVRCMLTPGHTKGSMSYSVDNKLFTGDFIFIEGCGICPCEKDAEEMYLSINKELKEFNDETLIYPGHSYGIAPGKTLSYIKRNNIYFNFSNVSDFAQFRLRDGQTDLFSFK